MPCLLSTRKEKPNLQVLNLFLALLLSSFSSDNLSAPEEDGDLNNIQVAIARIHTGISWLFGSIMDFFSHDLRSQKQKAKEASQVEQMAGNHIESNGGIVGSYGEKYIFPEEDSYMNNPNLTVIVPIAPGESDVEFLEEENSESSEDEDNKPMQIDRSITVDCDFHVLFSLSCYCPGCYYTVSAVEVNTHKAAGPDNISGQVLRDCAEGSTVDMRKPGEEEDDLSEMDDDSMEPENCFPECEYTLGNFENNIFRYKPMG
ncbi:hypothetical protein XENOCAPTIV_007809, partial [Xenoophorus captivus]